LNEGAGFAGYTDWRIPNQFELLSLVDLGRTFPSPAVAPEFNSNCTSGCTVLTCSCTDYSFYWSSTTVQDDPARAWSVYFGNGSTSSDGKTNSLQARAVRNAY
jgi:hypothetical protein